MTAVQISTLIGLALGAGIALIAMWIGLKFGGKS